MRYALSALALLTGGVALAAPAAAVTTFVGTSLGVTNYDTNVDDHYTVTLVFADNVTPIVLTQTTMQGPPVVYQTGYYLNLISATVTRLEDGFTATLTDGYSRTSTLASSRRADGSAGFNVGAGVGASDGAGDTGYTIDFSYYPPGGFSNTGMPTSLDIAAAVENGFNLSEAYYFGDPDDGDIETRQIASFRFAAGGIVPTAAAVPEPATWGMMILGFGMVGGALRYRRRNTGIAYA